MTEQTLPVSPTLRAKILAQAQYRCGYCLTQQIAVNWLLEVEHFTTRHFLAVYDGDMEINPLMEYPIPFFA